MSLTNLSNGVVVRSKLGMNQMFNYYSDELRYSEY